ncbi:uncharacterized protein MELLADRAFT_84673 [Melampsora larici-populina 98AG31]|uniref:Uncharacterized protein n=1 Tax=Melampsora larici-populina (strain 98AG31 / pathotype 3-4-7) TaxID=747676 RepID=F4RGF2_MELLP|nr:uncharacterized protein MELLADRAFT_84673 [Melampsora larici-populina 98AG31]EGG08662.1 hypothetical protein MELLADRAFT_84673 [Melampsora larici-populina 98AG31]
MSYGSYVHSSVFLPEYILESVIDGHSNTPRIDPESFLSKATPKKLLEVILAFFPHFKFTQNAQEDHELLRMIFVEMVAPRLRNLQLPSPTNIKYIKAPLIRETFGPRQDPRCVDSAADLDLDHERKRLFDIYCLPHLKNSQYRQAVEGLDKFIKTYKFLTQHELDSVHFAQEEAQESLDDHLSYLTEIHKKVERLHLQLRDGTFGVPSYSNQDKVFYDRLQIDLTTLRNRQILFTTSLQDLGLISALAEHHKDLLAQNQLSDSSSNSEAQDTEKDHHSTTPRDT